jgi:Bacterial regulatory helix-turn-helix protein, lysR family
MIRRFALLQTFVAVARAGKMKQAAHELALTSGAVSQRIRELPAPHEPAKLPSGWKMTIGWSLLRLKQ